MAEKIKVLISDDHKLIRQALRRMLEQQKDIEIIGEATNGIEAIELTKQISPDVILMDINMPEMDVLKLPKKLRPTQAIMLALSAYPCIRIKQLKGTC